MDRINHSKAVGLILVASVVMCVAIAGARFFLKGSRYGTLIAIEGVGQRLEVTTDRGETFWGHPEGKSVIYSKVKIEQIAFRDPALQVWVNDSEIRVGKALPDNLHAIDAEVEALDYGSFWTVRRGCREVGLHLADDGTVLVINVSAPDTIYAHERAHTHMPGIEKIELRYLNDVIEKWPISDRELEKLIGTTGKVETSWSPDF